MKTSIYISTLLIALFVSATAFGQEQLTEKQLYKQAFTANNAELYQEYLNTYPEGKYALKIEKKLETITFIEAYTMAATAFNDELLKDYLLTYPQGMYCEKAGEVIEAVKYQQDRYMGSNQKFLANGEL